MSTRHSHIVLGIDVGGSGIKAALVDVTAGRMVSERYRVPTPQPSTPEAMAHAVARIIRHFSWEREVGCGMPGPIKNGRVLALANLDKSWVGCDAPQLYTEACGCPVRVINDADAAGLAEVQFGAAKGRDGVVVVVTLGTGIGSALFVDGVLVPNTEFGQMELKGKPAERRASARVRKAKDLSWSAWGARLNEYFRALEYLLWPDVFVVGGGVSRKSDRFLPAIRTRAEIVPAHFHNEAGIIGAAVAATRR